MIRLQDIMQLFPPKLHIFPKAILREYLQYKILASIFTNPLSSKLCFIWWTALRIAYDSQRFSEDIDFDNRWLNTQEFEEITHTIKKDLLLEWYEIEIRHIYKWAFHCVIKVPQVLFDNDLANMITEKLVIKIDTTPQWYKYKATMAVLQKFWIISPYRVSSREILLSMKICAFFGRTKGRDLFDIAFLLSMGIKPDLGFLKHTLNINDSKTLKERILSRITELDLVSLQREVQPFLFDSNNKSVEYFAQIIKQTEF